MASEVKYADPEQVWKIWFKDGKETPLQFTTPAKLTQHKDKYPEIFEAVYGKDGAPGILEKLEKYVYSQGTEGEQNPTVEIGDQVISVKYFEDNGAFSISRKPKSSAFSKGGYKPAPLLTLERIYQRDIEGMNQILAEQKPGEVYRFSEMRSEADGEPTVVVLKLRQVN